MMENSRISGLRLISIDASAGASDLFSLIGVLLFSVYNLSSHWRKNTLQPPIGGCSYPIIDSRDLQTPLESSWVWTISWPPAICHLLEIRQ